LSPVDVYPKIHKKSKRTNPGKWICPLEEEYHNYVEALIFKES
jgi:hypothetical protein